jgi:hypothetical protein
MSPNHALQLPSDVTWLILMELRLAVKGGAYGSRPLRDAALCWAISVFPRNR